MRVSRNLVFSIAACLCLLPSAALAQVDSVGDVQPADNPFTLSLSEGLQPPGATVQVGTLANPPDDDSGNFSDGSGNSGQPFYEQNLNLVVGENSFGEVSITGQAILRNSHLVLGGSANIAVGNDGLVAGTAGADNTELNNTDPANFATGAFTNGFGVLRISGFGSTYNNHPLIVPTLFQDPTDAEATRFNVPDAWEFGDLDGDEGLPNGGTGSADPGGGEAFPSGTINRPEDNGFDAYVGFTGRGLLEITNGGRAEIQDAVIVGYGPHASGDVIVSGSGSYLANYGGINPVSVTSTFTAPGISQMVIGGFGTGTLRVEEGGQVQAFRGAAIGVTASSGDNDDVDNGPNVGIEFDRGGRGTVVVDGAGSRWDIFVGEFVAGGIGAADGDTDEAGLAIGEFVEAEAATSLEPVYAPEAGQGSLTISNGGRVRIIDRDEANDAGDLRIGRFGTLTLAGGVIDVQDETYSDGVISGDGEILAGRFINRSLGEVRVSGGERLTLRTDQEATDALPPEVPVSPITDGATTTVAIDNYFAANFGSIQVIGDEATGVAEFEYLRADDPAITPSGASPELRFINGLRTNTIGGGTLPAEPGEIVVDNGHLHFRNGEDLTDSNDGLLNLGTLVFVGGNNLVTGTVENTADPTLAVPGIAGAGTVLITGENTFVTFADGVFNSTGGVFAANSGTEFQLLTGSAAYSGSGTLRLSGDARGSVVGDFILGDESTGEGGTLELIATADGMPTLTIEGDFMVEAGASVSFEGDLGSSFSAGDFISLITVGGDVNELETNFEELTAVALPTFADGDLAAMLEVDSEGSLVVAVQSISASGAIGADFTGDGMVDDGDLNVFSTFFGLESGGSILTGDANGDGAVDAADFFYLQEQFGGAPTPILTAAVPEPSAVALLALAFAALGHRRNRHA